jgi:putative zinc finger/helix-turn-helix YgiT family protein
MTQLPERKPFPWKCGNCRERAVNLATVAYTVEEDHDGRTYTVTVPDLQTPRCDRCGELVLDDAANRQISAALRQQLGLLTPQEIRQGREALGLTQRQMANQLGIAEATLSRWETGGQIQQRALDRLLRLFFTFAEVREALADEGGLIALGASPAGKAQERGPGETAREARVARLAAALDGLPEKKQDSALEGLSRLLDLMKP